MTGFNGAVSALVPADEQQRGCSNEEVWQTMLSWTRVLGVDQPLTSCDGEQLFS